MKEILNLFDSETRAMSFAQMKLNDELHKQKSQTKNEDKIKEMLNERLCNMIDAGDEMRELLNKLQKMDEYELHVVDLEEFLK